MADFFLSPVSEALKGSTDIGIRKPCASLAKGVDSEMRFSKEDLVGSAFMAFGVTLFVGFFYAAVLSKLLPPYENRLLAAVQNDW